MLGEKLSGRYEILAELGRGGMGVVYRARDPLLNRDVAVKVIEPSMLTPETEQRFQTEAQVVAQMDHPSIVSIYDFGRHQGSLFFVMPIIVGESVRALQRKGTITLGMVVDVGIAVAEALDYSHARGVIHRDERVYPQLLYHFYEADDPEKTVEYGLLHARKSQESFSSEEVIRAAKMGLEFLDEDWAGDRSLEGEARLLLAAGHRMAGDMVGALKETAAAVKIFEREHKSGLAVKAILAASKAAWQVRQTEETTFTTASSKRSSLTSSCSTR